LKPSPLKKGDTLGIAAPAGPFKKSLFLKGVQQLKKVGFQVHYSKNIFSQKNYLAGSDQRRSHELNSLLSGPTKAILFARGGYGTQRILPLLTKKIRPKVVVGSSDLTILLNVLWQHHKLPSYYGPMVAPHFNFPKNAQRLKKMLTDPHSLFRQSLKAREILKKGQAEGRLIGGCLSLLVATLGTPWEVETKNSILFLEDTQEQPYAIDRMLTQLWQAGKFRSVKGIVFGTFRLGKSLFLPQTKSVIRDCLKNFKGPILWGIPFGHCPQPLFIPLGGKGKISRDRLIITEGIF